jgi:G3E family GTPase
VVPVLLLTGFLGSGKTTLLNRLLESRPSEGRYSESAGKLALIVNEFGAVGIDGDLLPKEMTQQIEIPGGCICCRLDENLEKTLLNLTDERSDLTAIIIETTGIAEPLPISWNLSRESLAPRVRLAAVITVVDGLEHQRHRSQAEAVDLQVDYADLLVISKSDLVESSQVAALQESLREVNEYAPIFYGPVDTLIPELWRALDDPEAFTHQPLSEKPADSHHHFESVEMPIRATLDMEPLTEALEELPPNYLRIKGIAQVIDEETGSAEPRLVAFHRVGARVSAEPVKPGLEPRIVAIGRNIDGDAIAACLRAAMVTS